MSHHSDRPLRTDLAEELGLGATGKHPEGYVQNSDEGEIKFAVGDKNGVVVVEFGKPVHWVGMNPQQATELGELLIARAKLAQRHADLVAALDQRFETP